MDQHSVKNVKCAVNKFDVVNKGNVVRTKFKSATGAIPNTVLTDHTLFLKSSSFSESGLELVVQTVDFIHHPSLLAMSRSISLYSTDVSAIERRDPFSKADLFGFRTGTTLSFF